VENRVNEYDIIKGHPKIRQMKMKTEADNQFKATEKINERRSLNGSISSVTK